MRINFPRHAGVLQYKNPIWLISDINESIVSQTTFSVRPELGNTVSWPSNTQPSTSRSFWTGPELTPEVSAS